jgi:hypothetical protein
MPKAKPTQVIVHRLELQQTERDAFEAALAGRFVTNAVSATGSVLTGLGAVLAPFSGALTAIAGVWLADKAWDELTEKVLDPIVDELQSPVLERYAGDYSMIVAWLNVQYASQGWDFLETNLSSHDAYMACAEGVSALWRGKYSESHGARRLGELPVGTYQWVSGTYNKQTRSYRMPAWLVDRFDMFCYEMKRHTREGTTSNFAMKTPAEWWVQFYPYDEFENEIIYRAS